MTAKNAMYSLLYAIGLQFLIACSSSNFSLPNEKVIYQQNPLYNNKVDVLIMVDDSTSMSGYQNALAGQMQSMVTALNQMGMDYHFAITTSSVGAGFKGGRFVGTPAYIMNSSPNVGADLAARLKQGSNGSTLEQGILSVQTALSVANLTGPGLGFLRDDAFLAIVYLSNDTDYSDTISIQAHVDFLNRLKKPFPSGAKSWVVNFLGVTSTSNCAATDPGALIGTKYINLVNVSEGVIEDICNANWTQVVTNVRVRINQLMTDFYLNRKPKLSSISVVLNGNAVAQSAIDGWTYEERIENGIMKYFIRFHGKAIPAVYDSIDIKFDPANAT